MLEIKSDYGSIWEQLKPRLLDEQIVFYKENHLFKILKDNKLMKPNLKDSEDIINAKY